MPQRKSALRWVYSNTLLSNTSLAAKDAVVISDEWLGFASNKDAFRISCIEVFVQPDGYSSDENVVFGIADGQNASAEIEAAIESKPTLDSATPGHEESMRDVWVIGQSSAGVQTNGGLKMTPFIIKPNHTFSPEGGMVWWSYNRTTTAFSAGNQQLNFFAKIFGVWVRS